MKINQFRGFNHCLDLIAFLAVLTTGILLILFHIPVDSVATIAAALSTLYRVWISGRPASRQAEPAEW